MTPQAYRVGIMQNFQANMAALNAARQGQAGAPSHVLSRAIIFQELTKMLPDAFPANSAGEGSRALPAIWTDTAGFQARIQAIQQAANGLVEAARGGNAEQIETARMALQARAVLATWRSEAPRRGTEAPTRAESPGGIGRSPCSEGERPKCESPHARTASASGGPLVRKFPDDGKR